jgi:hypothetical protein
MNETETYEDFLGEWTEGEIHFRDNLQFEVKSEFFIHPDIQENVYKQEFYIFIPNTLQINPQTYSKQQFYLDQTTLIRYKTPHMTFKELIDFNQSNSPLARLHKLKDQPLSEENKATILTELQLFGNIFRSTLRGRIQTLVEKVDHNLTQDADLLCQDLKQVRNTFIDLKKYFIQKHSITILKSYFRHVDEFTSLILDHYLIVFLDHLRKQNLSQNDEHICECILHEKTYRQEHHLFPKTSIDQHYNESILYREGLLNKFILEPLLLRISRHSLEEKHGNILSSVAAGIAMLIYLILFAWKSEQFVIHSTPFILLGVILYILKDRLKEGLKQLYYKQAFRWFPDYSTEIESHTGVIIGIVKENFSFVSEEEVPSSILEMRNRDFHRELQVVKRQETIIHYKREVILQQQPYLTQRRRKELTILFRLNIHQFLQKAHNPLQPNLTLDTQTLEIKERLLPRVYHINVMMANTYLLSNLKVRRQIKKFRVIVDKIGIKRVEQIK